ncbi:UNVERIFIED_CONTAM: hypothetical protein H355_000141 [Colinus virginianus]|nr:hypothetical protein H355_000141 [Colinus virginianus]
MSITQVCIVEPGQKAAETLTNIPGEAISGPVEAKLSDLLRAISSFLSMYPAVTGDTIQMAIATLIANINVEEADEMLIKCEGGIDAALDYAKLWCKYVKELLSWIEKRLNYETEFAKGIVKIAESGRNAIIHQNESLSSLRKSRLQYFQRCEELEKAKQLSAKAEDEYQNAAIVSPSSASKQLEKRRRSCEEAQAKVQETEALYKMCINDANFRRQELEKVRARIVSHIRKLIYQGDEMLTWVTLRMFKQRQTQSEWIPVGYQHLSEVCKPYRVGEKYLEFIQALQKKDIPMEHFEFEPHSSRGQRPWSQLLAVPPGFAGDVWSPYPPLPGVNRSLCSDTESLSGSCESRSLDSPSSSPGNSSRKLLKASSTGTMSSSDDFEERDSLQTLENENGTSQQQFRNALLSSAAQTHRLRKLRGPTKCRECDAFMVNGFECEECYLTCHKKCLENLLITCGHKKLPNRVPLFGIDFTQVPRDFPEEVPFIVVKCTSEIEARALGVQGIYRISGSKARVEKLCQAFENGRSLVELSEHSPHDITGVLKHFLKELSGPILLHRLYDNLIALAKELQKNGEEKVDCMSFPSDAIQSMKDLLSKLPGSNYNTLRHLIAHLVAEKYEENKMSPNNLGIVFGPTLIRPGSGSDVSMSCLVDSGYQAQIVEFLIQNYERVFGMEDLPSSLSLGCENPSQEASTEKDEGDQSPNTAQSVILENLSSNHVDTASDISPSGETIDEFALESAHSSEGGEVNASIGSEMEDLEEKADSDTELVLGTQPRGHFSRQPVKYVRAQPKTRANIPKPSSLPLRAPDSGAQSGPTNSTWMEKEMVEEGTRSRNSSPDVSALRHRGKQLKHFEITEETSRIISRFKAEVSPSPEPSLDGKEVKFGPEIIQEKIL